MLTKVAIVEDDARFRGLLEEFINSAQGLSCVGSFGSAEEALRGMGSVHPDVILMDIQLPNLSGIECTTRLKETLPEVPVIMLTVNSEPNRIFKALQAGASGYLLKRMAPQRLLPAIQEVLDGGAPMTGEIARKVVEFFRQAPESRETHSVLSRRELEVLELLSQGYSDKEIASQLNLGYETIRTHVKHIFEKLHVRSRAGAVARFLSGAGER